MLQKAILLLYISLTWKNSSSDFVASSE